MRAMPCSLKVQRNVKTSMKQNVYTCIFSFAEFLFQALMSKQRLFPQHGNPNTKLPPYWHSHNQLTNIDGATLPIDACRFTKSCLESLGNLQHHTIREAWPKYSDCEWHPILGKPSRARDTREIKNIGKVCKLESSRLVQNVTEVLDAPRRM